MLSLSETKQITAARAFEYARVVQGWMRVEELLWLHKLASSLKEGAHWVEVGCWKGRSYLMTGLGLPSGSEISGIDPFQKCPVSNGQGEFDWPGDWVAGHFSLALGLLQGLRPDITTAYYPDRSCFQKWERSKLLDVVFIDGSHETQAVVSDINYWRGRVKQDGFLCGHDRGHPQVREALRKCFGAGGWKEPKDTGSIWWVKL